MAELDTFREVDKVIAHDGIGLLFVNGEAHKLPPAIEGMRKRGWAKKAALLQQVVQRFGRPLKEHWASEDESMDFAEQCEDFGINESKWLNEIDSQYLKILDETK